jgi:hypothetical protein
MENRYKYLGINEEGEDQHTHLFDGRPLTGCSSVGKVLAKPLTWWAAGLAVAELGWMNSKDGRVVVPKEVRLKKIAEVFPKIKEMTDEQYLALLDRGYRAHDSLVNKAATAGTDRHALGESWVRDCIDNLDSKPLSDNFDPEIESFVEWSRKNIKRFLWSESHCYSEKHWLGGISDIGCEMNSGSIAIIDLKSSKEAYPNQFFQIGGYDICVSENGLFDKDGNKTGELPSPITAHIVFPFGMAKPIGIIQTDVERNKKAFLAELELYRILNSFDN